MGKLKKKLSGTTLIETIVSMILLVTIISLSFLSVLSIKKSFNNDLRTYAYIIVNNYINNIDVTEKNGEIIDYSSFSIHVLTEQFNNNPNLTILTVSAVTVNNLVVFEAKRVIKHSLKDEKFRSSEWTDEI